MANFIEIPLTGAYKKLTLNTHYIIPSTGGNDESVMNLRGSEYPESGIEYRYDMNLQALNDLIIDAMGMVQVETAD